MMYSLLKKAVKFIFAPVTTKGVFDSVEVEKLVNKGLDMADDIIYTKEEKAINHNKFLNWWLKYLDSTKGQNLARRELAVYSVRVFLFLVVLAGLVYPFDAEWSKYLVVIVKDTLFWLVTAIVTFYFGVRAFKDYTNSNSNGGK